ncbi:hypothetical protein M441DRAFT_63282 [Trichoderma asperellum CBS 433.97]|uniref:Homeobox domain-containing protein n=1 Tax=Trichoderma asperellum (strain ATCC 204424 / CBS 433.97 / NBRC 101777) TaxID=1042311 RepID=A0A2T3ZMD1_TRIA4|nr:hypothetical protein M441DRAFT_63282 [Trichoderma asperellum CBS 433.97]PTB45964.1 hypothetical protein M441DRAFT_63282 [Trichoderma asperellum CBS 433.97]
MGKSGKANKKTSVKLHARAEAVPYPSAKEKQELSRKSGLSVRQVSQWFVNARRRSEGRSYEKQGSHESHLSLSLPRAEQSATLDALPSAVYGGALTKSRSQSDISANFQTSTDNSRNSIASWPSSCCSSCSESPNIADHQQSKTEGSGSRHNVGNRAAEDKSSRICQCTSSLEQWTCLPTGPKRWGFGDPSPKCSLRDERDPSDEHLQSHRISDCIAKPTLLRVFHRKDHLHQRLRLAHGVDKMILSMNAWSSKISKVESRCGFCGENFSLWTDCNDHLADHFSRGKSMKDWKGDRGFEPSIAVLSLDLEPFSASKGVMKKILTCPGAQNPPNVFELLTAHIGDFMAASRASGATINCDILRRQARLILFGDDDPLNQTPADNNQWLTLFKIGHGPIGAGGEDDNTEPTLPWWCQSPECLADLMQMSQEFALTTLGDIEVNELGGKY